MEFKLKVCFHVIPLLTYLTIDTDLRVILVIIDLFVTFEISSNLYITNIDLWLWPMAVTTRDINELTNKKQYSLKKSNY